MRLIDADKMTADLLTVNPQFETWPEVEDWNEVKKIGMIEIPIERREPVMRWIPCEERLPEEGIRVQIQLDNGWIITGFYDDGYWYSVPDCGDALNGDAIQMDVLAWMPLPEPWKGEAE